MANLITMTKMMLERVSEILTVIVTSVCLNRNWAREMMKPSVWEISAGVPYEPLLINCAL